MTPSTPNVIFPRDLGINPTTPRYHPRENDIGVILLYSLLIPALSIAHRRTRFLVVSSSLSTTEAMDFMAVNSSVAGWSTPTTSLLITFFGSLSTGVLVWRCVGSLKGLVLKQ